MPVLVTIAEEGAVQTGVYVLLKFYEQSLVVLKCGWILSLQLPDAVEKLCEDGRNLSYGA